MRGWTVLAAVAALAELVSASGVVSIYNISDPTYGTCRLKGIEKSSDNFKYYASVSNKDYSLNDACARCITITRDDDSTKTTTAYVLDVCDGCTSGTLRLSEDSMTALDIDVTDSTTKVSYEFSSCPTSLMTGDIKACLMDGASATYVPLQFYNSQKVITGATIDGVTATSTSSAFLYSANSGSSSSTWYKSVEFSVTSDDGDTLNSTFAFSSTSGCATSSVQFNSASTADGVKGSTSSSGGGSKAGLIGGICGGIGALLIIMGSVIFVRRRNRASKDLNDPENDVENQYLSPTAKPKAAVAGASTFHSDHDDHNDHQPPASPTVDYAESFSPAASSKAPSSHLSDTNSASTPVASSAVPAAVVAASIAVDSPPSSASSDHSSVVSAPYSHNSSVDRLTSPEPVYVAPTYAYSNNMATSPRRSTMSNVKAAPTLSAPVVPRQPSITGFHQYEDEDQDRSSFDIDDMRESEARATSTDESRQLGSQSSFTPYSAADPYTNTVTSPQSYVRATSLRRPSQKRTSDRESGRYNNGSVISNADSYASAPRQTNASMLSNSTELQSGRSNAPPAPDNYSFSARPSGFTESDSVRDSYASIPTQQKTDLSVSQRSIGSLRESGGYSRESLNLLGYPYSKKSGRHHNTTEMQF